MSVDEFDKLLRMRAQQEPTPLPESFVRRVRQTCVALPQKERRPERKRFSWPLQAAAVLVLLLVAVSNLSPAAAQAMQRVPVLGQVVEVITLRNYLYEDDHNRADVQVPQIEAAGAAGAQVNEQVQADTDRLVAQFEADMGPGGLSGPGGVLSGGDGYGRLVYPADRRAADHGERLSDGAVLPH